MKFEIKQHFNIESARFLPHLPPEHPCAQMHGHSFKIILRIHSGLDGNIGWVMDYNEISKKVAPILALIDHKVLNNVPGLENPTSEFLAFWLYRQIREVLPDLVQISVAETPQTECSFPALMSTTEV